MINKRKSLRQVLLTIASNQWASIDVARMAQRTSKENNHANDRAPAKINTNVIRLSIGPPTIKYPYLLLT